MAEPIGWHTLTSSDWSELQATFHLTPEQREGFQTAVDKALFDIQRHVHLIGLPGELRARRTAVVEFRKRILAVRSTTFLSNPENRQTAGLALLDFLADHLRLDAMERLLDAPSGLYISEHVLESRSSEVARRSPTSLYRRLEQETEPCRRGLAADHSQDLLRELLDVLNRHLLREIALLTGMSRRQKGRPFRNHLILILADAFQRVMGERPTTTPTGRFAALADAIMDCMGVDTTGLDEAIIDVFRQHNISSPS